MVLLTYINYYIEKFKNLTSAKIHDFDFEVLDFGVEFLNFDLEVVALFVHLVALGVDFATQLS